ncbi:hypothetical protein BDV3_000812 [Batrachochytrium dendrobatidis]
MRLIPIVVISLLSTVVSAVTTPTPEDDSKPPYKTESQIDPYLRRADEFYNSLIAAKALRGQSANVAGDLGQSTLSSGDLKSSFKHSVESKHKKHLSKTIETGHTSGTRTDSSTGPTDSEDENRKRLFQDRLIKIKGMLRDLDISTSEDSGSEHSQAVSEETIAQFLYLYLGQREIPHDKRREMVRLILESEVRYIMDSIDRLNGKLAASQIVNECRSDGSKKSGCCLGKICKSTGSFFDKLKLGRWTRKFEPHKNDQPQAVGRIPGRESSN